MGELFSVTQLHPTPWTLEPDNDGLQWVIDATGKAFDCTTDDYVDLYRGYVTGVNIAALVHKLYEARRAHTMARSTRGVSENDIHAAYDVMATLDAELIDALCAFDPIEPDGDNL